MKNISIYDGRRLAQPDEVANYKTGDGLEKAFVLANIIRHKNPEQSLDITVDANRVILKEQSQYQFVSTKRLRKRLGILSDGTIRVFES
ncbi:MAG: hypothetical protein ACYTFW_26095 [Planctomycetota bacterium]|jgi:hypothetical protein